MRILTACFLLVGLTVRADSVSYTYDDAGRLVRAAYSSGRTISYSYDRAGNLVQRLVSATQPGPAPAVTAAGVVNAASFLGGAVAPGEIVTLFGTGIGPAVLVGVRLTPAGFFDTTLADTRVLFDGVAAPLVYVSQGQTSAIVPYRVAGNASTQIQVEYQGRQSSPVTLAVAASAPALFSLNASGKGGGAVLNQDSTVNTAANPAEKGSIVVLYGTGEGQTSPAGMDGQLASGTFPKPVLPVSVAIGGQAADILYYGAAPGLVAGVIQVNARVPAGVASGAVPVVLTVGTASSQPDLTVAVR